MNVRQFADSAALIVGGSSGVGLESACQMALAGVPRIALVGRDASRLEAAARKVSAVTAVDVAAISADATDVRAAIHAAQQARARLGRIDILVNAVAGDTPPALLTDIPPEEIERTLYGQLLAPLLMTRLVLPCMYEQEGGSVVNVASDAAKVATPGETVLGAAVAGIVMFSRAAAMEAKRHGVRVNAVTPSLISGTRTTELITREGFSARLFAQAAKQAHLGVAEPPDVAALIVFLAGPAARRVTGQAISVNGGISAA
jgi:NAD(P)-dependent dehydrogenase (short-subunit alcohol dehydrogenase family)